MKKLFLTLILLCGAVQLLPAQRMRDLFMSAPGEVMPLLGDVARADCIDYLDAGMEANVSNAMWGKSSLKKLTDDYFLLQTTPSSSVQAKLLPFGADSLICVVKSVKAEAVDSHIAFYDLEWNRLEGEAFFDAPRIKDFFISPDSARVYEKRCDIYLVSLELSSDGDTLVAEYTMPYYMNIDDAEAVRPLLGRAVYRWNGRRFEKE